MVRRYCNVVPPSLRPSIQGYGSQGREMGFPSALDLADFLDYFWGGLPKTLCDILILILIALHCAFASFTLLPFHHQAVPTYHIPSSSTLKRFRTCFIISRFGPLNPKLNQIHNACDIQIQISHLLHVQYLLSFIRPAFTFLCT